jgi:methionyl-tRNA formyltransferase
MSHRELRLALFALTGLGNGVLEELIKAGYPPSLVITRAERMRYPYDESVPFIGDVAAQAAIPCLIDIEGERMVVDRGADLLLAATYHRRVGGNITSRCNVAINLHPSLLPRNRGSNPFFWSIRNGDTETGVTAHVLTEELDAGAIVLQRAIGISADETQSTLRGRLGRLAADMAVIVACSHGNNTLTAHPQDEKRAPSYPRLDDEKRRLDLTQASGILRRHINALRDWPLALLGNRRVKRVVDIAPATPTASVGTLIAGSETIRRFRVADADLIVELDECS